MIAASSFNSTWSMYHCFGMVMGNLGALCHGASVVYPAPSFHAAKTLRALVDEKCTGIFGVPTMFTQMITEHGSAPPIPSLRTGLMAGSSCPEQLMLQVCCHLLARHASLLYLLYLLPATGRVPMCFTF
jgi:fatty-acyl-CoA synthase